MSEQKIYCSHALLNDGWREHVLLEIGSDGLIENIRSGENVLSGGEEQVAFELKGRVIPGMPNLHSHGFQRLIGGLTGASDRSGDNFWGWRKAMYGFANRISADQFQDCMNWVYVEMLKAGFTSCAEFHYLHHQADGSPFEQKAETSLRVLSAADNSGMAVTLLPVFYKVSGFGQKTASEQQRRFSNTLDTYLDIFQICRSAIGNQNLHKLGLAPHSLRAVPADDLQTLLQQFSSDDLPIHIHIAEQTGEVEECEVFQGQRPVNWLLENAEVNENWCLVHATHMDAQERQDAAGSGAVAGLCPSTEADLGDGFFDAQSWLNSGGRFGIGSDSNLRISVSEELRLLEFSERLRQQRRDVLRDESRRCGRFLYEHAARSGARALGQNVGSIMQGCRADLVELDSRHPQLDGRKGDSILDSFVFAGGNEMIRSVFVGGKQVISDGHHTEETRFRSDFTRTMKELLNS